MRQLAHKNFQRQRVAISLLACFQSEGPMGFHFSPLLAYSLLIDRSGVGRESGQSL